MIINTLGVNVPVSSGKSLFFGEHNPQNGGRWSPIYAENAVAR